MSHSVSWEGKRPQVDSHLPGKPNAFGDFALGGLSGAARVSENDVGERVAAYLLGNGAGPDLLNQRAAEKERLAPLVASGILPEPIVRIPRVRRPRYLGVLKAVLRLTSLEKQMAQHAPRC